MSCNTWSFEHVRWDRRWYIYEECGEITRFWRCATFKRPGFHPLSGEARISKGASLTFMTREVPSINSQSIVTMTRHGMPTDNRYNPQLNPNQPGLKAAPSSRWSLSWQQSREHKPAPAQIDVSSYTQPFLSFLSHNPTIFHTVAYFAHQLEHHGFTQLSERQSWTGKLTEGGKYFFERNGSSLVAFVVGNNYRHGNGAAIIASHVDVITTRLKPISSLPTKAGYVQLAVAPYAGGLSSTWWDRDLGIGGRVLVKDSKTGKITARLVKLGWPIARVPTLAPHFGAASRIADANPETRPIPIIGLDGADDERKESDPHAKPGVLGGAGTFTSTQPSRLVKAIALELGIEDCKSSLPRILDKLADILRRLNRQLGTGAFRHSASSAGWSRQGVYFCRSHRR